MKKFKYSQITPEKIYKKRRSFVKSIGLGASSLAISTIPFANKSFANDRHKNEVTKYPFLILVMCYTRSSLLGRQALNTYEMIISGSSIC